MRPELSDLMRSVAADAPPPRYGVDDAVAAGRRLRRRRRAGVAIAAVVAVAAVIAVPQIVTNGTGRSRPVPLGPTPTPAATKPYQFTYTTKGYTAGGFRVAAPTIADVWGYQTAAAEQKNGAEYLAKLQVFRAGVDPRSAFPGSTAVSTAAVNGRPAYFVKRPDSGSTQDILVWEYADGASALLWTANVRAMTPEKMRTVAEGFVPGPAHPATVPFRVSHIPDGYRLVSVSGTPSSDGTGHANLTLLPEKVASSRLAQAGPGELTQELTNEAANALFISAVRLSLHSDEDPGAGKVACLENRPLCSVRAPGGRYILRVSGNRMTPAELRRVLASIQMADMAKPGTWTAATEAVPRSAQLPAR